MRVWICVNGILSNPGSADGWTDRAVTWLHRKLQEPAEKFEYLADAIFRRLWQRERAENLLAKTREYLSDGWDVCYIAHSNGCDLIDRTLALLGSQERVRSAHLIAAAADGAAIARALASGGLAACHLYGSPNDRALALGRVTRVLGGWAGIGYGSLGLKAEDFAAAHPRCTADVRPDFGHGTWLEPGERFEETMQLICRREGRSTTEE